MNKTGAKSLKPSLDEFADAVAKTNGNLSDAAVILHVSRQSMYNWIKADEEFAQVVNDSRKKMFDECLSTARILALGIPNVEKGKLIGWKERPDGQMLRYFLQTLGRDEGFGRSLDITSNGEALPKVINLICDDKAYGDSAPLDPDDGNGNEE